MIPTLYDKTGNNKIGDLNDCIECLVEEERNGIFELTMIQPANSSILESIVYDNIIVADANDYLKSQKFRVYNTRKLMANRIEVCARHISFDLVHDWVDVISIENQSCEYALNTIFRNSQFSKHFKGHSDIVNAQNFKVNKVTCLEAIGGTDGSIIDTYGTGAEILRDNTDIHVLNRRGHDNDVTIEYRKNLTGLEVEEDTTDLVTRIMPYAIYTNSNNEEVEVRGDFINSPLINNYAHPYIKYIDYSEKFEDGETPTVSKLVLNTQIIQKSLKTARFRLRQNSIIQRLKSIRSIRLTFLSAITKSSLFHYLNAPDMRDQKIVLIYVMS